MFCEIRNVDGVFLRAEKLKEFQKGMFGELSKEDRARLKFFEIENHRDFKIKSYKKEYRSQFSQYTEEILPMGKTVVYFRVGDDQSIRGYKNRLRSFCGSNHTAVTLTDEMINHFGIPSDRIKQLDSLPLVATSSTSGPASKEKVFVYNGKHFTGRRAKDNWDAVDIDLTDGVERVYVVLDRYQPSCGSYYLREFVQKIEEYNGKKVEVYGIKTALTRQKRWEDNSDNFLTIHEYKEKYIALPKTWINDPEHNDCLDAIEDFIGKFDHEVFDNLLVVQKQRESQLDSWYIWDWSQVQKLDSLSDAIKAVFDEFPMLKMITWRTDVEDHLDAILDYIELKKN